MVHPNQHEQPSPAPPVPTSPAAETAHEASDCAKAKFPQQCTTTTTTVHTNNANTTETRDESETAGETGTGRRLHVETKADWGAIYTQPTPVPYYTTMTPYDYGHYHDRLLEMLPQEIERVFPSPASPACPMMDDGKGSGSGSAPVLRVVEFGASYGNTTLGYRHGLDWQAVGQVWLADGEAHDQAPSGMGAFAPLPRETRPMHVTAVDLSGPALAYGKRKGLYDETVEVDFNQVQLPLRLVEALGRADVLVLVMVSSYITTLSLQRIFLSFLSGAGGGGYSDGQKKLLVYNDTCAFDTRNLSPSALLAGVKGWTAKQRFTKHRDFTEEERQKQHGCRESWSYTYLVEFADLDQNENRNAH